MFAPLITNKRPSHSIFLRKMSSSCCFCCRPTILDSGRHDVISPKDVKLMRPKRFVGVIRASKIESTGNSNFVQRMERAWLISQQPRPIVCSTCDSKGQVECKWCSGTGFFVLGDNMLCQVPSRNTTCVICAGKGYAQCCDCRGTGFRAKWLGKPLVTE